MKPTVLLFGESQRGDFNTPLRCDSLSFLCETLGEPPEDSQGIQYAIQALLYDRNLFFYRVKEEGFSSTDYLKGFYLLQNKKTIPPFHALLMPGVGDKELLEEANRICKLHKSVLIITEKDLYDYLMG